MFTSHVANNDNNGQNDWGVCSNYTDDDLVATTRTSGIERVQALADISRSGYVVVETKPGVGQTDTQTGSAQCCHGNETRAPIANPPNSTQLEGTPYHSPSYIRVSAVVWECGQGQTGTVTQRHTDARDRYTFRVVYDYREMYQEQAKSVLMSDDVVLTYR